MRVKKLKSGSERPDKEQKVLSGIREGDSNIKMLNWFFEYARNYAQAFLMKRYPDIEAFEWDVIFANVNLKFITRIRNGIELEPGTRLTTYYTSIAKFATLDLVCDRRARKKFKELEAHQAIAPPSAESDLEQEERAGEIKSWLMHIVGNEDQVRVLLLQAEGLAYRDIVAQTGYQSEGACRNAMVKGKKKIAEYLTRHPEVVPKLKKLLQDS